MAAVQGYNAIIDSCNPKVAFSGFSVACVGSVSSRVIARKFPSPSTFNSFFALVPIFSTNSRGNACYAGQVHSRCQFLRDIKPKKTARTAKYRVSCVRRHNATVFKHFTKLVLLSAKKKNIPSWAVTLLHITLWVAIWKLNRAIVNFCSIMK